MKLKKSRVLQPGGKGKPRVYIYLVKNFTMKDGIGTMTLSGYPATPAECAHPDAQVCIWYTQNPYRKVIIFNDKYYDVHKFDYELIPDPDPRYKDMGKEIIGSKVLTVAEIHLPEATEAWLISKIGAAL